MSTLIERLRTFGAEGFPVATEAADELERLTAERDAALEWNGPIKGEIDALRADAERWRYFVTHCEWIRHDFGGQEAYSSMSIRLPFDADQSCVAMRNAAIDAARAPKGQT